MSTVSYTAPILIVEDFTILDTDPLKYDGNIIFKLGSDRGLYILNSSGAFEKLIPQSEAGGWTYVKLAADSTTTTTSNSDTLLAFTPLANTHYEIEGKFFLESAATTTGVRPGIKWPTVGLTRNVGWMISPTSATAFASRFWGNTTAANAAATATAVANEGIYGEVKAMILTDANISGDFIITIASEVSGSQVKINADSFIRYRAIG